MWVVDRFDDHKKMWVVDRFDDHNANEFVNNNNNIDKDLALRIYTSRLIGCDSSLVLHGGGNTSVKLKIRNVVDEECDVIAVKGSGHDLKSIGKDGFPMVDLEYCRKLRSLKQLSDHEMVNALRTHLLSYKSPNPSVETLLHAFLPHKFVDHTHADHILALCNQENAVAILKDCFGDEFGIVEYIMPGFRLSIAASEVYNKNPNVKGLILLNHGLFTFAETAKESYQNHIIACQKAQEYIQTCYNNHGVVRRSWCRFDESINKPVVELVFLLIRGIFSELSENKCGSWELHLRRGYSAFSKSREASDWIKYGPITPDHIIRTKYHPALIKFDIELVNDPNRLRQYLMNSITKYCEKYKTYFDEQQKRTLDDVNVAETDRVKIPLDPLPRVLLISHIGLVTIASTTKAAIVAADIYEHTIQTIQDGCAVGSYKSLSYEHLFDMEYWSLEQAKLKLKLKDHNTNDCKIVWISGASSGIGYKTALQFLKMGHSVMITDIQSINLYNDKTLLHFYQQKKLLTSVVDVCNHKHVQASFYTTIESWGGVDIVISNAGGVFQDPIDEAHQSLRKSFELNFFSHHIVASMALKIMKLQNMGGCIIFNASKAAFNPGKNFGPYATAKAGVIALMKQFAVEGAPFGIRSNAVNADRVKTNLFTPEFIKQRAEARNISESEYFKSNLLQREVLAEDVAEAFYFLSFAQSTTAGIITVDGGNIAASCR